MAIVGLKMVTLALVDPKTQQLLKEEQGLSTTGIVEIDSSMLVLRLRTFQTWKVQLLKFLGTTQYRML